MDAVKALSDVPEARFSFWFHDGTNAKNLYEFRDALARLDDDVFRHHVNSEKNDFCNWISSVIGDPVLARRMRDLLERKKIITRVNQRIRELERMRPVLAVH